MIFVGTASKTMHQNRQKKHPFFLFHQARNGSLYEVLLIGKEVGMKKIVALTCGAMIIAGIAQADLISVNFDTVGNWAQGSVALTSYASDHTYTESGFVFTGGPALRNTTTAQDGFAGALGTYSWRLQNVSGVSWTATYTQPLDALAYISQFGLDARRWDGDPNPVFVASYSVDGGANWTTASSIGSAGTLDNAAFGNSSAWSSFSQSLSSPAGLAANQFVVRLASSAVGERIMVDNFSMTTTIVPEPGTLMLMGIGALGLVLRRRMK